MKREIKFRGKRVDNVEWVYGYIIEYLKTTWIRVVDKNKDRYFIEFEVIPETVGQYTGLKDKNGKEIYEGDILNGRNMILKIVYWCDKRAAFCESEQFKPIPAKHSFAKLYDKFGKVFNKNGILENHFIVGNIYENPELLTDKET